MHDDDLRLQIKKLAFRLQRLERHVGLHVAEAAEDAGAVAMVAGPPVNERHAASPIETRVQEQEAVQGSAAVPPASAPPAKPIAPSVPSVAPHPAIAPIAVPPTCSSGAAASVVPEKPESASAPPKIQHASGAVVAPTGLREGSRRESDASIESTIGIKVLGGIGAILVVIGAAFLAREYGTNLWFTLPAWVQAMSIAFFGGVLLLGGELALRKLGKPASLGLYGAGLGVLYMDAFATFQWFEIVSRDASFLLMGLVAACGFAITLRTKFLSIGVLSLIGGYLAPLLLWRDAAGVQVMAYLTMLAGIALALSAWQPRPYRPLRYVAFGGLCLLGFVVLAHAQSQPIVIVVFASFWWTMFTAEAVLAAMRRQSSIGNVVISLLGTAAYVTCSAWILNFFTTVGSEYLGAYTAMIAILSGAIAMHFGPGLDSLRGRLDTAIDKLAVALWAQMGVLLTIAIAMQFDGFGPSVGWLVLGLASIEIGRRLPSAGVSIFGLIVFGLGVLRVVTLDQVYPPLHATLWTAAELRVDQWAILGLITVIAIHAAAKRTGGRGTGLQKTMPIVLAVFGAIGWFILAARQANGFTLTSLLLAGAVLMLAVEPWNRREKYLEISLLMLLAVAAKWLLIDALARRIAPGWDVNAMSPVFNVQMGLAVAIAVAGWWGFRRIEARNRLAEAERQSSGLAWQIAAIIGGAFLLIGLTFEVDRAVLLVAQTGEAIAWEAGHMRQLLFTLLWAFGSAGFGLFAMMMRRTLLGKASLGMPLLLGFAWSVLLACAVKWIVVDTLMYAFILNRPQTLALHPLGNVQMLAGAVLAAIAMFLLHVGARLHLPDTAGAWQPLRAFASIGASMILLWGLTFEIDRALGRMALDTTFLWDVGQLRAVSWGVLWAAGGFTLVLLSRLRGVRELGTAGWTIAVLAGTFWLIFGALIWRAEAPREAAAIINVQFMSGAVIAALLASSLRLARGIDLSRDLRTNLTALTLALIAILGFTIGSLEIDRAWAANPMVKQMGLSIYWALYGAMLVLVGFVRLSAPSRYVGLALLFITIAKVLAFDMQNVDQVWRILSLVVSGLLLIGTSMAYAKLSPKLLETLTSRSQAAT